MKDFDSGVFKIILFGILWILFSIGLGILMWIGIYHLINQQIDIPAIIETFKK